VLSDLGCVEGGPQSWCTMFCNCAANFRQFYLLLWKNFVLQVHIKKPRLLLYVTIISSQIRRPVGTVFELILPLLAVVLVIGLK